MKIRKPSLARLQDELEQSNLFGANVLDLLTTQHFAHGADLVRAFCRETGRVPNDPTLSLAEVADWLDSWPPSSGDDLEIEARHVAIEVYFGNQTPIRRDPSSRPSRSEDDHVDPGSYDFLARDDQIRRLEFNYEFDSRYHQDDLLEDETIADAMGKPANTLPA